MAISLKPLGDRVVIEPIEQDSMTAGGIVLPDTAKEKPQQGTVLAIGPDVEAELAEGDRVMYAKYAGTEVKMDGKEVIILSETDILAIVA
ncbi:MAG: co-chaperone GroES [Chloroflexi bacterium]|nr:co-chaperone GroES [Chloroflexota bacterium]